MHNESDYQYQFKLACEITISYIFSASNFQIQDLRKNKPKVKLIQMVGSRLKALTYVCGTFMATLLLWLSGCA